MSLSRDATQIDEENIGNTNTAPGPATSPHSTPTNSSVCHIKSPVWSSSGLFGGAFLQIMQQLEMVARPGLALSSDIERERESLLEITGRVIILDIYKSIAE